jgi:hypothetical protein
MTEIGKALQMAIATAFTAYLIDMIVTVATTGRW